LDLTSAFERIKAAKEYARKSSYAYWEEQIKEVEIEAAKLSPVDGAEIRVSHNSKENYKTSLPLSLDPLEGDHLDQSIFRSKVLTAFNSLYF